MGKKLYELNIDELKQKKKIWKILSYTIVIISFIFILGGFYLYFNSLPLLGIYICILASVNLTGFYFLDNSCEHLDILIRLSEK